MKVKGTTRNDFDTKLVMTLLCSDAEADFERILGEACCVIDGLRADLDAVYKCVKQLSDVSHSHWRDTVHRVDALEPEQREPGTIVLINFNDEAGCDWYSVEAEDDVGNWLDSFETMMEALNFIGENRYVYDHVTGFRDTRAGVQYGGYDEV